VAIAALVRTDTSQDRRGQARARSHRRAPTLPWYRLGSIENTPRNTTKPGVRGGSALPGSACDVPNKGHPAQPPSAYPNQAESQTSRRTSRPGSNANAAPAPPGLTKGPHGPRIWPHVRGRPGRIRGWASVLRLGSVHPAGTEVGAPSRAVQAAGVADARTDRLTASIDPTFETVGPARIAARVYPCAVSARRRAVISSSTRLFMFGKSLRSPENASPAMTNASMGDRAVTVAVRGTRSTSSSAGPSSRASDWAPYRDLGTRHHNSSSLNSLSVEVQHRHVEASRSSETAQLRWTQCVCTASP
jgi:hypothetical protein